MIKATATRLQQVTSCNYQKISVKLQQDTYCDVESLINALKKAGYDSVDPYDNGVSKNIFLTVSSKELFKKGSKFHTLSITATPIK